MSVSTVWGLPVYKASFWVQIKEKIHTQSNQGCINKCGVIKYILMYMLKTMFGFIAPVLNASGDHTNTCLSITLRGQNQVYPRICHVSENLKVALLENSVQFSW